MKAKIISILLLFVILVSCHELYEYKTVVCIPVYGQSLALGEEAERITDFDSLANYACGRIVTENLDHQFGYFDNDDFKKYAKKLIHYQKRAFELTVYSMAEVLADSLGIDTVICTFPGGQGATTISHLGKGTEPYEEFLEDIETAFQTAQERGWTFVMPALCWMQGETDVTSYPGTDFRKLLLQFVRDINDDVKRITGQENDVEIICYQTNPVTRAERFDPFAYDCPEAAVPQSMLELVRDNPLFHASGPTYPYTFVREAIHIDGQSQRKHGELVALSALDIIRHQHNLRALLPLSVSSQDFQVIVSLNVPCPPLLIDTVQVAKVANYGFSVITPDNRNIAQDVSFDGSNVYITCSEKTDSCNVRYAVNGEKMKSGRFHGPRGNLRDSQGHWCWQFDMAVQ